MAQDHAQSSRHAQVGHGHASSSVFQFIINTRPSRKNPALRWCPRDLTVSEWLYLEDIVTSFRVPADVKPRMLKCSMSRVAGSNMQMLPQPVRPREATKTYWLTTTRQKTAGWIWQHPPQICHRCLRCKRLPAEEACTSNGKYFKMDFLVLMEIQPLCTLFSVSFWSSIRLLLLVARS